MIRKRILLIPVLLGWLATAMLLAACGELDLAAGPLLHDVTFATEEITPNADGDNDVVEIRYSLRRPAAVSIYFDDTNGARYYFRTARRRAPGDYSVLWGGAVDQPQVMETDYGPVEVLSRVLPDGVYTYTVEAIDDDGMTARTTGQITLAEADTLLPELKNFAVVPQVFRPNQDGLADDRVSIGYYLTKDAESVTLFLQHPERAELRYFIAEEPGLVEPTARGYHDYSYDGGVDLNAEPPPDGLYKLVGEARDAAGNVVRVVRDLTLEEGGKPRADVVGGEIDWLDESNRVVMRALGDKLCFTTYVANESQVPIRTSGPWPGQEYHFGENYNTLAAAQDDPSWLQQDGAWRFGINFDTTGVDFPFRWAVGRQEDLERRMVDGEDQWYLMPGKRGEVSGCIVLDSKLPIGTRFWWGGLIHQGVAVVNNNIDQINVQLGVP